MLRDILLEHGEELRAGSRLLCTVCGNDRRVDEALISAILRVRSDENAGPRVLIDVNAHKLRCSICGAPNPQVLSFVDPDSDEADSYYVPESEELSDPEDLEAQPDLCDDDDEHDLDSGVSAHAAEWIDWSDASGNGRFDAYDEDNTGDYFEDDVADLSDWEEQRRESSYQDQEVDFEPGADWGEDAPERRDSPALPVRERPTRDDWSIRRFVAALRHIFRRR